MDSKQYKDLKMFISRCMFGNPEETGKVKRFVITHLTKAAKLNGDVGFVPVDAESTTSDVDNIINEIETMINADADGFSQKEEQRYIIRPTFANASFESSHRCIVKVQPVREQTDSDIEDESSIASPDTTNAMVASSLMRHNENLMRLNVGMPTQLLGQAQKVISRQQDTIDDLHEKLFKHAEERLKTFALMEDLLTRRHLRELASAESAQKMQLAEEALSQVKLLAPMVVNKLAGKSVLPQASTPAEMMLKEFMKSLTREQFEKMLAPLDPQQQFPLLLMYQEFIKQQEAEEAKKAEKKPSSPPPESEEK